MVSQQTPENKASFLKNDRALVCSMLVFYSICILGLIGVSIWWLGDRNQKLSISSTATASFRATERAQVTATAVARTTEQAGYDWTDTFDLPIPGWRSGNEDNEYWKGDIRIEDGMYLWDIQKTKETFISKADFPINQRIKDFDAYVDIKVMEAAAGDVCSGLMFRKSPDGWDEGTYEFAICNNSWFKINYHTEKDGWEDIISLPYMYHPLEWNRLEISARGSHFTFAINGNQVFEMNDERLPVGGLAIVVEVNEAVPVRVAFDNFGYQPR